MEDLPLTALLKRLARHLTHQHRRKVLGALLLILVSGLLEMLSLASVQPLLLTLMRSGVGVQPALVASFCVLVITAAGVRWYSLWMQMHLAAGISSDLAKAALARILHAPYQEQRQRDRAATIALLAPQHRQFTTQVLQQILLLVSGALLGTGVLIILVVLAWWLMIPVTLFVAISYGFIHRLTAASLKRNGAEAVRLQRSLIRQLQNSMTVLRELILREWQAPITEKFGQGDRNMRQREADNAALSNLPRYVIEPAAIVGIAISGAMLLHAGKPVATVLPTLGLLAFAAQRLLPLGQQVWTGWAGLQGGRPLLESLLDTLDKPLPATFLPPAKPRESWSKCELNQVWFGYTSDHGQDEKNQWILKDFNLSINRGEWVALRGASGSGKSTTVDLILGLLSPTSGDLKIDNIPITQNSEAMRSWQAAIAHAAAVTPLIPGTVSSNLEEGLRNREQWRQAIEATDIAMLLDRDLGDSDADLSTGQRQRVAIARALLRPLSLLVLDEATSGLDMAAEAKLLMRLRQNFTQLTVLIISHRQSTWTHCDRIIDLETREVIRAT